MTVLNTPGLKPQLSFPICWTHGEDTAASYARASELAAEFNFLLRSESPRDIDPDKYPLVLSAIPERIELLLTGKKAPGPVGVDFTSGATLRRASTASRRQPLARAIFQSKGAVAEAGVTVLDATAGLGRDAFVLAWLGGQVTAVERSQVLYALLRDGIERGLQDAVAGKVLESNFRLLHGDAGKLLSSSEFPPPEVIYLDPMYPPKRKESAAVKKEMQILQTLLGAEADSDADRLLEISLQKARKRVVVKRPSSASPLAGKPDFEVKSKLVRYDVYLTSNK